MAFCSCSTSVDIVNLFSKKEIYTYLFLIFKIYIKANTDVHAFPA